MGHTARSLTDLQLYLNNLEIDCQIIGDQDHQITKVSNLATADNQAACFVTDHKYLAQAQESQSGLLIIKPSYQDQFTGHNLLLVDNPYLAYAYIAQLFDTTPLIKNQIDPSAIISEGVILGDNVRIGALCYLAPGVKIGDNTIIESHCSIGENSSLGESCHLHPHVVIYHGVTLGDQVAIHSHSVIGSDGFGFALEDKRLSDGSKKRRWIKIPQLGGVVIGNRVDIGASCTIDRGTLDDTTIADDVIIDNQIHLAHNVAIGKGTAMAGGILVAGSTTIGDNVIIGGATAIVGHIKIDSGVMVKASSFVTKSLTNNGSAYSSAWPAEDNKTWGKKLALMSYANQSKLKARIDELEQQLNYSLAK